jgi:hypothetical protein
MRLIVRHVILVSLLLGYAISSVAQTFSPVREPGLRTAVDSTFSLSHKASLTQESRSLVLLPAGAVTAHYGFFCRQELKWDKALPFQLRIRAGAPADCDRLEGKRRD